jgi:glucuronokinase
VALAGNPSDAYGGAVLALALEQFEARALAREAGALAVEPPAELVTAAAQRFGREFGLPGTPAAHIVWSTTVPRGVGLAGSSAIVIATLRALCALYDRALAPPELAALALAVEVQELGIAAGLQDRVVQAHGGLVFMDFREPPVYEPLDPGLLPGMLVAWRPDAAADSGVPHTDLRGRHERGDPEVRAGIEALRVAAHGARAAALATDPEMLALHMDASFDARRRMMALDPRHVEMVHTVHAHGAGANYTGSGGAIVAVFPDPSVLGAARAALHALGCDTTSTGPGSVPAN